MFHPLRRFRKGPGTTCGTGSFLSRTPPPCGTSFLGFVPHLVPRVPQKRDKDIGGYQRFSGSASRSCPAGCPDCLGLSRCPVYIGAGQRDKYESLLIRRKRCPPRNTRHPGYPCLFPAGREKGKVYPEKYETGSASLCPSLQGQLFLPAVNRTLGDAHLFGGVSHGATVSQQLAQLVEFCDFEIPRVPRPAPRKRPASARLQRGWLRFHTGHGLS